MVEISFSLVEKSRGSAAAEVEFAGKHEVTRDRRPLCVITNRPTRIVLFNRTKVQEVHTRSLTPFFHAPISEWDTRRKKERCEVETQPSEKTKSSKDAQIFERANDISRLDGPRQSNPRVLSRQCFNPSLHDFPICVKDHIFSRWYLM